MTTIYICTMYMYSTHRVSKSNCKITLLNTLKEVKMIDYSKIYRMDSESIFGAVQHCVDNNFKHFVENRNVKKSPIMTQI